MNPMLAVKSGAIVPVLALPVFYPLNLKRACSPAVLIGMAGALAVYYMAWGRFITNCGAVALLSPLSASTRARPKAGQPPRVIVAMRVLIALVLLVQHAQRPGPVGAPLGGDPLPILFDGRHPVRGDRIESR